MEYRKIVFKVLKCLVFSQGLNKEGKIELLKLFSTVYFDLVIILTRRIWTNNDEKNLKN